MTRPREELPYIEYVTKAGATKRIYADAWISEEISATATITEHAVETGAKVNDHYLPDQLAAKCSLFISGSPIRGDLDPSYPGVIRNVPITRPQYPNTTPLLSPGGLTQAAVGLVGTGLAAVGLGSSTDDGPGAVRARVFDEDPAGRLHDVHEVLLGLRQTATLVAVGFSTCRVENLALSTINLKRSKDDGDSGTIDLEFQQLNFVSTQSAAAIPVPIEPRAKPKGDSVTVSAADASPQQKSAAKSIVDGVLGR